MNLTPIRQKLMNARKKILVLGAAVVDVILQVDRLPRTAEDVTAEHKETVVGGCAYNVANILRQLGADHDLFVPVGKGICAEIVKRQLEADGYPLWMEDPEKDNGWNLSLVEKDGERTFITVPGIETRWKSRWFDRVNWHAYDYLYLSGYELEGPSGKVILQALDNRKPSSIIVFDPGPRVGWINREDVMRLLRMGTIVHANRQELRVLTEEEDLEAAVRNVCRITHQPVVVTLGEEGALFYTADESGIVPAKKVAVVDTIGAGDAHTAALMAGLAADFPLREACALGNEIAAMVVQQQGGKLVL